MCLDFIGKSFLYHEKTWEGGKRKEGKRKLGSRTNTYFFVGVWFSLMIMDRPLSLFLVYWIWYIKGPSDEI